ncbi:MAG TPA: SusC/RagA family TonB-linked outer membrane protein, partial [Flavisolibacter sp.]|nr:SusC/RagA family TonB-linked outer membrane protein [Flavisolibacter sp.]
QDDYSEYAIQSLFYRANYNFRNKYLVELNGRYDGSSKFPPHHRFGFFPSASVGWQIGREHFMDRISKSVNELKVRASYGTIGNQNINPYAYAPSMAVSRSNVWAANNDLVTVLGVPALVSDNFTWESVTSADAGVDFALFHSRLQGVFDWYQRDTRDMLSTGSPLPAVVGAAAPLQNTASMRTRGFEIALNWNDRIGNVKYRLGVNLYNSSSWITKYTTNTSGLLSDWYVGKRIGEIWGYVADGYYSVDDFENLNTWKLKSGVTSIKGINVRPGDVKYKNLMDDANSTNQIDGGVSTLANPGDTRIIGNTTPKYQYGVNAGVNYKGLDLNIMLQGIGKRDYWLSGQSIFPFAGSGATDAVFQPLYYNQTDYWTPKSTDPGSKDYLVPVNPNPKYFRIYNQMENVGSNTRVSNKYLQNASYLRIKNVTLSYTLPQTMLRRTGISALRFFISAENLATFTSLPKGYDPEPVTLQWTYPFYRTISGGLNVTL